MKDAAGFSGVWREVHFEEWTNPGSAAQLRARHAKRQGFLAELPAERRIVTIAIVREEATTPLNDEQRAAVGEGVAQVGARAKAAAVMIGARGFKAVIIRSIIAALTLVQRSRCPTRSFDDLEATFAWVAPMLDPADGNPITVAELAAAYRALLELAEQTQAAAPP